MRILLAEDEKSLARALVTLLKKHHYEADAVYDGAEALAYPVSYTHLTLPTKA